MKKTLIFAITLLIATQVSFAQSTRRAKNLYDKRSYIKAAELYSKVKNKDQEVLENLGNCYFFTSDMKNAAKWYDLLLKKYQKDVDRIYYLRYAQALKGIEKFDKADEWYSKYYKTEFSTADRFEAIDKSINTDYLIDTISSNSDVADFAPSFYGDKIVFASSRGSGDTYAWNNQGYLNLYQGDKTLYNDVINPELFSDQINTKVHEATTAFTKDGNTVYFTRNNFNKGVKIKGEDKATHLKIYRAQKVDSVWKNITELPFNSDNFSCEHPALSPDEKKLYFASDRPGSYGSFDLYVVEIKEDGSYGEPENLGVEVNTPEREQFPFVSEKNILYFASDGHFGLGGLDVFKSTISKGPNYSKPQNLGSQINSSMDDFGYIIDEKTNTGFFASNRPGGKGDDDIYWFAANTKLSISGIVTDKYRQDSLPGSIVTLYDIDKQVVAIDTVGTDAKYEFTVYKDNKYTIKAEKEKYVPYDVEINTNNIDTDINEDLPLILEAYVEFASILVLRNGKTQLLIDNVHFDTGKWKIKDKDKPELDKIVNIMTKIPDTKLTIEAHTDFVGGEKYNQDLSEKRGNAVKEYLVENGIDEAAVTVVGYGETKHFSNCEDDKCTDDEKASDRRCEFILTH